jgi:hypothetical protein
MSHVSLSNQIQYSCRVSCFADHAQRRTDSPQPTWSLTKVEADRLSRLSMPCSACTRHALAWPPTSDRFIGSDSKHPGRLRCKRGTHAAVSVPRASHATRVRGALAVVCSNCGNGRGGISRCLADSMKLWDVKTQQCMQTYLNAHDGAVFTVVCSRFSPHMVVSGGDDCKMKQFNLRTPGKAVASYVGHSQTLWACDIRYDEAQLVSSGMDGTVLLWDPRQSGRVLGTLGSHRASPSSKGADPRTATRRLWWAERPCRRRRALRSRRGLRSAGQQPGGRRRLSSSRCAWICRGGRPGLPSPAVSRSPHRWRRCTQRQPRRSPCFGGVVGDRVEVGAIRHREAAVIVRCLREPPDPRHHHWRWERWLRRAGDGVWRRQR